MTGPLRQELADYLALRRALGYRLARPEKLLGQFLDHLEATGEWRITVAVALDWARQPAQGSSNWWAYRLCAVRGFASYLHALNPAHEVPAAELLPHRPHRATPYLYSDADIAALTAATASLRTPLRRATIATLTGLLSVTGARVGEAIALNRGDLDLTAGLLLVRHGKFDKTRELALHPTTVDALRRYQRLRDQSVPGTATSALLVSTAGTRLTYCNVHNTFHRLVRQAGLAPRSASCRPRIHDLRHTFAVQAMLDAYAAGQDGQARLTLLSTWRCGVRSWSPVRLFAGCHGWRTSKRFGRRARRSAARGGRGRRRWPVGRCRWCRGCRGGRGRRCGAEPGGPGWSPRAMTASIARRRTVGSSLRISSFAS